MRVWWAVNRHKRFWWATLAVIAAIVLFPATLSLEVLVVKCLLLFPLIFFEEVLRREIDDEERKRKAARQ